METSTITSKGQILIPKRIRTKYGINAGSKILFEETKEGVIIKPLNEQFFKSLRGILKSDGNLLSELKQMKKEESTFEAKKMAPFTKGKKAK